MRIFKWLKKFSFLIVLAAVNLLLCFLIEPANGASARMWSGYYAQEELDTIFVGSSVCQQTFIPEVFDEKLGVKSYNMGTPSQAMPQTLQAIEVAMEEHEIKTIVYAMGFSSLMYEPIPEAEITFESARVRKKGGIDGTIETIKYMFSEDVIASEKSVNFLFPWLYNYEELTVDAMVKNAEGKLQRVNKYFETGIYDETDGLQKGFRNDDYGVFNYDNRWVHNTYNYYGEEFSADMLEEFETMLVFCQEHDVELIVINAPHPAFDVVTCYQSYAKNESILKEYCEKYDADYYDFSLAKPEVFETKTSYFGDYEHLNREGAEVFCRQLSEFMRKRADGEDMSHCFYSVEEFLKLNAEELQEWQQMNKL